MKNFNRSMMTMSALAGILAITACTNEAQAAPVDVTLGYENNSATKGDENVDSVRAEIGTLNKNENVSYGITTLVNDNSLRSYGVYAGLPMKVQGTKLTVEPRVSVEQYREESELVGSAGVGARYEIVPSFDVTARAMYSFDFDSDDNIGGESYMVGLTKRF